MGKKDSVTGITKEEVQNLIHLLDLAECAIFKAKQEPSIEVVYANKKFYSMLQYTPEEFKEKFNNYFIDVLLPEEKQRVKSLIARQSAAGGLLHLEFRVVKKDGSVRWFSLIAEATTVEGEPLYCCSCIDITQQKRHLDEIYEAKKEVELITNSVPGGVIKIKMSDYKLLYANDGFYRLTGYSRTEYFSLFGNRYGQVVFPDDKEMVQRMFQSALENRGAVGFEYRIVAKNGEVRWSYVNGTRVDDQDGSAVYLCVIMDITSRKKLEEKSRGNALRSKHLLEYMQENEWTYRIKEQQVIQNGYIGEHTYSGPEVEMLFKSESLHNLVHPDDVERLLGKFEERSKAVGRGKGFYRIKDETGTYRNAEIGLLSISSAGNDEPDIIYGQTRLIDDNSYMLQEKLMPEKKALSSKMFKLANDARAKYSDVVTGLISYDEFIEEVEKRLFEREEGTNYGLLCCDINSFQKVNYHYGISVGNNMLVNMGKILKENLALDNLCTRINGDYFMVFFRYAKHSELAKKISQMLRKQTEWEESLSYSTYGTTCGIYLIQPDEQDSSSMFEKADLARRSIKGMKGSHYAIYTEELEKSRFWEEEVLHNIGDAMANHAIEVFYLPRIRGDKENVIGSKSVPRVQVRDGNYLTLEDLRRYLDRSEAVQQLVFYVLSQVCTNLRAWKAKGKKILPVSVDITAGQLCLYNAVNKLDEIVKSNQLSPRDIIFEIQESYFSGETVSFQMALEDLSRRGYKVIISRFASDHTAVHSIRQLPVSGIKFHGEFFNQNITNSKEQIVFKKIVEMVKEMDLGVACGGITTKLQEDIARSIGCDVLEGEIYYGAVRSDIYEKCFLEKE